MKQVLFIQGAGEGAYEEDKLLAGSLRQELGAAYIVHYPAMPDEGNAPYEPWKQQIQAELDGLSEPIVLVGHSIGASYLTKYVTENEIRKSVRGIFLLAAPFWGGDGWIYEGYEELEFPMDTAARFPKDVPVFLYHARDDEIVPFDHLALYTRHLLQATAREIDAGGHQFSHGVSIVARDITGL